MLERAVIRVVVKLRLVTPRITLLAEADSARSGGSDHGPARGVLGFREFRVYEDVDY